MNDYGDLDCRRNIISVRITDAERKFLERLLNGKNMTISDLVREALGRLAVFPPTTLRKPRPASGGKSARQKTRVA
ncbi:hypothetical protein M1B72_07090 [Geomonas paludis]|uniref:Ribbon-helix-helix protein CopG domain-containing protein n=1 Tax=Geomonas paludis TaxID=2740185 RepID=A0A6V8MUV0_9BACT|nr:hypothetical protein [Geomonas paludis]UPU37463.1 hypothetical protein M1B72_07090 [Geomonas paludis]GFO63968.1 hypothetical protein GMPD_18870 [Geomonas paludis]